MAYKNGEWKPTKKQAAFLSVPSTIKEAVYGGGNGSGKSDVLLMYGLTHKWHENPRYKQLIMRRTHQELKKEIVPRSYEYYLPFGAKFNATDMFWVFPRLDQYGSGATPNGARIYLGHCENEKDVHIYDSMEINVYSPDELQTYTEWIYLYIAFTRVRTSDPLLPAIIRGSGMPGDIGHTWMKRRFVDPCPTGGKRIVGKAGVSRIYIHATVRDNPHLLEADPDYISSLEALPEAEKQARLYGSWDAYLGQVFEEFRDKNYPDEPENALHVIEPFDIPDWWPKIIGMDWGFAPPAMTWVGAAAVSPEGRVYIYQEFAWQKTKIEEWCAELKPFIDEANPRVIKLCKSASQDRGQEHTILQQISTALDRSIDLSNNQSGSRVAGKMLLHEYLRWKPKFVPEGPKREYNPEHADYLLQTRTLKEYKSYLDSFDKKPLETNLPKLQIFNTCPLLINAIKAAAYDKTNTQDVAEFPGDDPYDGIRYIVDAADSFVEDSQMEYQKLQKQQALLDELKRTNDQTAFYRNARKLDQQTHNGRFGVRRYHHA